MLILTRRVGEAIKIGNDIDVTVLSVKGNQVRIGINAPRDVIVDREEIAERRKWDSEHPEDAKGSAATLALRQSGR